MSDQWLTQGLRHMIAKGKVSTRQQRERDVDQRNEHIKATEIYLKHDPDYKCLCSQCRV